MSTRTIEIFRRDYPIRGVFRISRGEKTVSNAVVVRISHGTFSGWGECIPYAHYGESVDSVVAQIEAVVPLLREGLDVEQLQQAMPAGAARNALDCALWDLCSRASATPVSALIGLKRPAGPVTTAFTISLDTPDAMADAVRARAGLPMYKLKLGGDGDLERVHAVRLAAPDARLIADANESWTERHLDAYLPELVRLGLELLEQPLPAGRDDALHGFRSPVPLSADESFRDRSSIGGLLGKYQYATVKLDKTGGLTEALATVREARAAGLKVMLGCMIGSSLSVAPGILLAALADVVHLDGPMLLQREHEPSLVYDGATVAPDARVWSA